MSGQRVRCAGAVWLTTLVAGDAPTHSQRRQAHLKAEVCSRVLNVLSGQTLTQRESQKLFALTRAGAVETTPGETTPGETTPGEITRKACLEWERFCYPEQMTLEILPAI